MLSEVSTSHIISNSSNSGVTKVHIEDDKFDQFGAVLDVRSQTVTDADIKRVQDSIGVRNVKIDKMFEFEILGNRKTEKNEKSVEINFNTLNPNPLFRRVSTDFHVRTKNH